MNGTLVDVRRVAAEEWPAFKAVRLAALAESPAAFGSTLERELAFEDDIWQERARIGSHSDDRAMFLAWSGDHAVGLVGGNRDDDGHVELVAMWVSPDVRGRAVGQRLVAAVLDFARATSTDRVELWVVTGNEPAQRLYESMGFAVTGDFQPLPNDPCKDEVRMRHPLT